MHNVFLAFALTLIAGISTGFGSLIALVAKKTNTKFLSISLGFSAGVMIYVSMIELFAQAKIELINSLGNKLGSWTTVLAFFLGIFLIAIIDRIIPQADNPHELKKLEDMNKPVNTSSLKRLGILAALAIGIHNFPEGMATFFSALEKPSIAIPIVVAIAIHNIPEGIAVSVPIYFSTGSKKKAFVYSFLSGLSEPIGALIGYLILMPFINNVVLGIVLAAVAGIMVFISLDELLPAAREYGEAHLAIYGLVSGMIVMAISLLLFVK